MFGDKSMRIYFANAALEPTSVNIESLLPSARPRFSQFALRWSNPAASGG